MNPKLSAKSPHRRELILLLAVWFLLAVVMITQAKQNLSVPGLYYDEAVFAGMAKDFVTGEIHGEHMPDTQTVKLLGRPFPVFIQTYLGALKSWMLIPAFKLFGSSMPVLRSAKLFGVSTKRFRHCRPTRITSFSCTRLNTACSNVAYLNSVRRSDQNVDVRPYFDREGQVAFYTIQFRTH